MCPLYVSGLIGPGDRKSIAPMAKRLGLGECDQLHHFIAAGVWDAVPVEAELLVQADRLVGGSDAVLVIDDTALPKKGTHSVGVVPQYASALGKTSNCQTLVSLTLARGEVPVMMALRLFLPETGYVVDRNYVSAYRADFPGSDGRGTPSVHARHLRFGPPGDAGRDRNCSDEELALFWEIYSRRCSLQIHFRQCGHWCGVGRMMSSRISA
jgi:DDE superfamily endonuclease